MNRFFFNEPRGTILFSMLPPWSGSNLEAGTDTIPNGISAPLWIVQYANPPSNHYWTCRYNAAAPLNAGNSRFEFAVKATGTENIAFHTDQPIRNEARGVACRWTSASEGELFLPANTIDIFVGVPGSEITKGTSAVVGLRPTPIATGGRVKFNLYGARLSNIVSTADVLPDEEIVAWWNEYQP